MTCIVGFIADDGIYMGADSAGVDGSYNISTRLDKKVFIKDEFIIGFTSSFRMGQLIQYSFNPPKYIPELYNNDIFQYMCTAFIDSLRKCLKDGGYSRNDQGEESGGCFLVGFKGRLFEIADDFQVGEVANRYNSVGCGFSYALGSLYADILGDNSVDTEQMIKNALECAEYFSAGVRRPFNILKLGS
jgi:hypothetical protein